MSLFEDSYRSQLQGVSQQVARERLDGQVAVQRNMLSDTVTNLRRRPGGTLLYNLSIPTSTQKRIKSLPATIGGKAVTVHLNTEDGRIYVLENNVLVYTSPTSAYLTATDVQHIRTASVGDELFFANTKKQPVAGPDLTPTPPDVTRGFVYIRAGAFSKQYRVQIDTLVDVTYTTPDGTNTGDAAASSPEGIAAALLPLIVTALGSGGTAYQVGAAIYIERNGVCVVKSPSGLSYIVPSNRQYIRQESDLPSSLPDQADGMQVSVGDPSALRYYRYAKNTSSWLEAGKGVGINNVLAGSPQYISNVPVSLKYSGAWSVDQTNFEGRNAGDGDTNPNPEFIARGITGLSEWQGRLVIFAGPFVTMSASREPRRFYRSTVTSLLDSDPISISSTGVASASWEYGVPYQKDLLLFAGNMQGVLPGSNIATTPRTAAVLPTSEYTTDMTMQPLVAGRSLLYAAPRSEAFFGLLEMLPSGNVDSQYTSQDSTQHLPKFMPGRCRFAVSSSVASMVLFAPTGDTKSLIVHEYVWAGDQKLQQAWHQWVFEYDVVSAYFNGNTVVVTFLQNGVMLALSIDPRRSRDATRKSYLDFQTTAPVVDGVLTTPAILLTFDPTIRTKIKLAMNDTALVGEPIGHTLTGVTVHVDSSFPEGTLRVGIPYRSEFQPTHPIPKDSKGVKITTNKMTVRHFILSTNQSAPFNVEVHDSYQEELNPQEYSPLYFSSPELELGSPLEGADSASIIPARTRADSTRLTVWSDGVGELNIVGLEYSARFHQKIKRAG